MTLPTPSPTSPAPQRPVLLISGGPSMQEIWHGLAAHYDLAIAHPQLAAMAQEMRVPGAFNAFALGDADDTEIAENAAAVLAAKVVNATPEIERRMALAAGPNRPPELNGRLPSWWPGYLLHGARDLALRLTGLEKLNQKRNIVGCIVHEDVSPEHRALVLWAKAKGIPTIHIPHAPCHLLPGVQDIHRETRTDWIFASGPGMAQFYVDSGFPQERIVLTGAPQWDSLYGDSLPTRDEARRVLKLDGGRRVICYATTWAQTTSLRSRFNEEFVEGMEAVVNLARAWDATLILKVHPHEAAGADDYYKKILEDANLAGLVTPAHLGNCLRAADLLVAQGPSNICINAAIAGTPSVYIQTEGFDFSHALPFRTDSEHLPMLAQMALDSKDRPAWSDFIAYYNSAHPGGPAGKNDGTGEAALAVVQAVEERCPLPTP